MSRIYLGVLVGCIGLNSIRDKGKSQSHEFAANERTLVAGGLAQRPPTREYDRIEDRIGQNTSSVS